MKKAVRFGIVFVLVVAAIVFAFMYSRGNTPLNHERKLRASFPNVEGLIEASPLLLNGFRIGEVKRTDLQPTDSGQYRMLVTFVLTSSVKIPDSSYVRIISADLFNKAVELVLSDKQTLMPDTAILEGYTEETFADKINREINPLKTKAKNLLASVDTVKSIINTMKSTNLQANLQASFKSIKKSINTLKQTSGRMSGTAGGPDSAMAANNAFAIKNIMLTVNSILANISKNQNSINRLIANINNIADPQTKANVTNSIQGLNTALATAKEAVAYVNAGKGTAGKALNSKAIQDNLDKANKDLDVLLKDMIKNPDRYFRVSVFAPKKVAVPPDSI